MTGTARPNQAVADPRQVAHIRNAAAAMVEVAAAGTEYCPDGARLDAGLPDAGLVQAVVGWSAQVRHFLDPAGC